MGPFYLDKLYDSQGLLDILLTKEYHIIVMVFPFIRKILSMVSEYERWKAEEGEQVILWANRWNIWTMLES